MKCLIPFIFFLFPSFAFTQVANDNIVQRLELQLDSVPVHSSTRKATVEWSCINKALTNSCLVYHNDQWFYFIPTDLKKKYLNINNQHCKNFKGVQVVVIEGNPCETQTYKLIHCTSFTDQNDTFIELDSLKPGVPYLVLIDGFLGDQCDFEIQFSTRPAGFPIDRNSEAKLSLRTEANKHQVTLQWDAVLQQLDELSHFEVYRQRIQESTAIKLAEISILTNTLGLHSEHYEYADNLSEPGSYVYQILGVIKENANRIVLDQTRVEFYPEPEMPMNATCIIQFPVNFEMGGEVELVVVDAVKGTSLFGINLIDGRNNVIPVDVSRYVNQGTLFFRIKAIHKKSRNTFTQTYLVDEAGKWSAVPK